jgi:uncharacterized protein
MEEFLMEKTIAEIAINMVSEIIGSLSHNWIPLSLSILVASVMRAHVDPEKVKLFLLRTPKVSIAGSVLVGALTPLCACGTMGVIIGMLTTTMPWGPVMAFLTSSPLMSPDGFIMISGIISYRFAIGLTAASIIIGLGSGYITHLIETRTNFLQNQSRVSGAESGPACS